MLYILNYIKILVLHGLYEVNNLSWYFLHSLLNLKCIILIYVL